MTMIFPNMSPPTVQTSTLVVTIAISVFSLWWFLAKRRKKQYVYVGKVSKLFFYPVKSFKGTEVTSVDCVEKGIQVDGFDDRCYSLATLNDRALYSQYENSRLVLLTPHISGNHLCISGPGMENLTLDLKPRPPGGKIICCVIDSEETEAIDCGDEAASWFQKFLNKPDVRLVYNDKSLKKRKVIKNTPILKTIRQKSNVSFQNVSPFLVLSQESIDDLNSKLPEGTKISVWNFRPNILIEGCNPYDEDKWSFLKFSSGVEMNYLMPCGRCNITTNDPETGIKTNKEPLVTLRKYRTPTDKKFKTNFGSGPLFGIRFGLVKPGKISVGDDVYAVVEQNPFNY